MPKTLRLILGAVALSLSFFIVVAHSLAPSAAGNLEIYGNQRDRTLTMRWRGEITSGTVKEVSAAFAAWRDKTDLVVLSLNSPGGTVSEGEGVIALLKEIKKTHKLYTYVGRGDKCASLCVALFLQGQRRFGARASVWQFHEVGIFNARGELTMLKPEATETIFAKYYVAEGVSEKWLNTLRSEIKGNNVWKTGDELIKSGSNIITIPLDNIDKRIIASSAPPEPSVPAVSAKMSDPAKKTGS